MVERLSAWRPTIVAVEADIHRQDELTARYTAWQAAGGIPEGLDEIEQVGFRVAAASRLSTPHAVDLWEEPRPGARGLGDALEWARAHDPGLARMMTAPVHGYAPETAPLRMQWLRANQPDLARTSHARALATARAGNASDYVGLEWATWWYRRNLAVHVNVLALARPGARILLMFGAAHVHLLTTFLEESGLVQVESAINLLA